MDVVEVYVVADAYMDYDDACPLVHAVFTERWRADLLAQQIGGLVLDAQLRDGDGCARGDAS